MPPVVEHGVQTIGSNPYDVQRRLLAVRSASYDGVWVSQAKPDHSFAPPELVVANFGYDAGWRVEHYPRLIAEFNPGRAIGFRGAGVWVPRAQQAWI